MFCCAGGVGFLTFMLDSCSNPLIQHRDLESGQHLQSRTPWNTLMVGFSPPLGCRTWLPCTITDMTDGELSHLPTLLKLYGTSTRSMVPSSLRTGHYYLISNHYIQKHVWLSVVALRPCRSCHLKNYYCSSLHEKKSIFNRRNAFDTYKSGLLH